MGQIKNKKYKNKQTAVVISAFVALLLFLLIFIVPGGINWMTERPYRFIGLTLVAAGLTGPITGTAYSLNPTLKNFLRILIFSPLVLTVPQKEAFKKHEGWMVRILGLIIAIIGVVIIFYI